MKKTKFHDKLLPVQPLLRNYFKGSQDALMAKMYETITDCCQIPSPLKSFKLVTSNKVTVEDMASNPVMLRFLEMLVRMKQPKRILEIGTFVGVSAMSMAKGLPKGGKIVTVEKFDHFAGIARKNFQKNGFSKKISVIEGDAFQKIAEIKKHGKFDMIFIDGNKERYADYFKKLEPLLNKGGLMLVDDVFFHGDAFNAKPKTEKGAGARKVLQTGKTSKNYHKMLLPVSNGLMLFLKQ